MFNIQRFTLHDGPGIRTAVFLKGCPLRCLWCSNPESQDPRPQLVHFANICVKCDKCLSACPAGALLRDEAGLHIDRAQCNRCGACVNACLSGGLRLIGRYMNLNEVTDEVVQDMAFSRRSRGGLTISGGEPSMQWRFSLELLSRFNRMGWHTCMETCGHQKWEILSQLAEHTDLVFCDIKHMDPQRHTELTGLSNDVILRNLEALAAAGVPVIARIPVIPGINDSEENLRATAAFVRGLSNVQGLELVPYHKLGQYKYALLGGTYQLDEIASPPEVRILELKQFIRDQGIQAL